MRNISMSLKFPSLIIHSLGSTWKAISSSTSIRSRRMVTSYLTTDQRVVRRGSTARAVHRILHASSITLEATCMRSRMTQCMFCCILVMKSQSLSPIPSLLLGSKLRIHMKVPFVSKPTCCIRLSLPLSSVSPPGP